jgi:3-phenylpropionate/trans-cinnamate dioxygenase ferredoxin reductase component
MAQSTKYLLVGGGLASVWAAQNIRERDKEGRVVIVSDEKHPPYDKPPLSKQYVAKDDVPTDDAYSKFDNWYPDNNVDLILGSKATRIDRASRTVTLENGDTIQYEKLLLALGADPRELDVPGSDLNNVFYLRTIDEAEAIRAAAQKAKRAVLIGAGYLNIEVGSGLLLRGLDVTFIDHGDRPWSRFASRKMADFIRSTYEARGAKFLLGEEITAFMGGGSVAAVTTKSGEQIEADLVVISVGATLRLQLPKEAGLEVDDKNGVVVDEYLQSSDPNIYVAGDIAYFNDVALGKRWHAEHHLNAKWQGRAVGAIMAGERKPYNQVPYFFSDFLDLHMVLRGDPAAGNQDNTTVYGDMKAGEFVELYPDDRGRLRLGVAISHEEPKLDPISDKLEELVRGNAMMKDVNAGTFGM